MANYSIKDIEKLSGIKAHTLRIWEKRFKLLEPKRTETNIRYYDDEDLRKILNVALLYRKGYRISQIACLGVDELINKITNLSIDNEDNESKIDNLVMSMVEMDDRKFEKHLNNSIIQSGFEDTVIEILYPFFNKIGILWQTGAIYPAQEHFISNLVRQKIISAIDGTIDRANPSGKHFLLFLPEGEMHELGLLFYHYLLKKRGHRVTYLGQSVPLEDLKKAGAFLKPNYIVTKIYTSLDSFEQITFLEKLSSYFPKQDILFSGFDLDSPKLEKNRNLIHINDANKLRELLDLIDSKHQ
ncbi:MAG: MerR family transcriptional regulator [Bacteroidales bacterium]|nr:MerR family transcriptional regulator [Bacteroidales bacterium]MCF8389364.1 MerR family transcriptional regulator [Bacteroidales bacterium]